MMIRPEIARTAFAARPPRAVRSVPVRLIKRVAAAFGGHGSAVLRRAVPARLVLVRRQPASPLAAVATPAVRPVRLLPRATARVAVGRTVVPRRRGSAFYYQVVLSALLAGAVITVAGQGTLATFNSAVKDSAVLTTGTLVLGDTINSGTECLSFTGGANTIDSVNANAGCTNVWSASGTSAEPGAVYSPQVTIILHGSLTAATFQLYANASCSSTQTAGETYHGGGNLCAGLQLYVQQYTASDFATPLKCLYGAGAGAASCTGFDSTHTLADFGSCHLLTGSGACAGGGANGPITIAVPTGAPPTSYFKVYTTLPLNAGNSYQGQAAGDGFTWSIGQ